MSSPISPVRQRGIVRQVLDGPPAQVQITLGGDEDLTHAADVPYLDCYQPRVGDVVEVHTFGGGSHVVLGRWATGRQRTKGRATATVTGIVAAETLLVAIAESLRLDGAMDVRVTFSWDSVTAAAGGTGDHRLEIRLQASLNGGAWSRIGRVLVRTITFATGEQGGTATAVHDGPAAGNWSYRAVAIRNVGNAAYSVNASATEPMTITAERWT